MTATGASGKLQLRRDAVPTLPKTSTPSILHTRYSILSSGLANRPTGQLTLPSARRSLDQNFAWAGTILRTDVTIIVKDIHNASGAVVAKLEAAL